MSLSKVIKQALVYGQAKLGTEKEDAAVLENLLLQRYNAFPPYEGEIDEAAYSTPKTPDALLGEFRQELMTLGKNPEEIEDECAFLLGVLTPLPSRVTETFSTYYDRSPALATDYLYRQGIANNYIPLTKIQKNVAYVASFPSSPSLEITINLAKPEKNNKDIAKLLQAPKGERKYPLCALCKENVGYPGIGGHAPRENLRIIPLHLEGEKWYLQYSPYQYYAQHCILIDDKHEKMEISRRIFALLLSFVDLFPHFFIGSNSDLPIVGGSILNHEHFQGGFHRLPLFRSLPKKEMPLKHYPSCRLEAMDFYDTALRLTSQNKEELLDLAEKIRAAWCGYEDPENQIIAHDENGRHNTITPLAEKKEGTYHLYLILRNNRCDETYPEGIFHAHPEFFHIKKEGIGLIEAAGRFILPARLVRQQKLIQDGLRQGLSDEEIIEANPELSSFLPMIKALRGGMSPEDYYAEVCRGILRNVAVYKNTPEGEKGLEKFLQSMDL